MADFWADLRSELKRGVRGKTPSVAEAEWLPESELAAPAWRYDRKRRPGQVLLGYARDEGGRPVSIGTDDNRHLMTIAGSRAGKGRSLLIPNLLLYEGSALVLDPKGELAAITARRRAEMGQKVIIIDPFDASRASQKPGLKQFLGAYNPLSAIDTTSPRCIDDAAMIAAAMVQIPSKGETHWAEAAQILLTGCILYVCEGMKAEPHNRHMGFVDLLLSGNDPVVRDWQRRHKLEPAKAMFDLFCRIGAGKLAFGHIARVGAQMGEMAEKELSGVVSNARTQCRFLGSPELTKATATSTFDLADLKRGADDGSGRRRPLTVYLCLPASMMASHGRWLRVMIELAMVAFERTAPVARDTPPTLFVLEELCTTIGYSKQLEAAAGLMAGYGVKLWSVVQDLSQLQHHYERSWETFVGNAGTLTCFGNSDSTTLKYISEKLGQTGLKLQQASGATPGARLAGAADTSEQLRVEPLLSPTEAEQLLAREKNRVLVLPAGKAPFILRRADYVEGEGEAGSRNPFAGMYDRHD